MEPYVIAAGLTSDPPSAVERQVIAAAIPLVHERMDTLRQGVEMMRFLLVDEGSFAIDEDQSVDDAASQGVIAAALTALGSLSTWRAPEIEAALRAALIDGLGLKPKVAFGPVRVAVTGRKISPPLFESLEILGPERSLRRLAAAQRD